MSFYVDKEDVIIKILESAHDPNKAKIRHQVKQAEYKYFRKHIRQQNVLVCGSGLGHDTFELAGYNKKVVGIELLSKIVGYSKKELAKTSLTNVEFFLGDFLDLTTLPQSWLGRFDSAVMNMGTIGNFATSEQLQIMQNVLQLASVFHFTFYPPTKSALATRKQMYSEEHWSKVSIKGTTLVSAEGLYSKSYTKKYFSNLAEELGVNIYFQDVLDFVIIATISSKK